MISSLISTFEKESSKNKLGGLEAKLYPFFGEQKTDNSNPSVSPNWKAIIIPCALRIPLSPIELKEMGVGFFSIASKVTYYFHFLC